MAIAKIATIIALAALSLTAHADGKSDSQKAEEAALSAEVLARSYQYSEAPQAKSEAQKAEEKALSAEVLARSYQYSEETPEIEVADMIVPIETLFSSYSVAVAALTH